QYGGGGWRENTHNLYLQMLAETGILGFAAFILVAGPVCATLARALSSQQEPRRRAVAYGGLTGAIAFLLTLLTGHTLLLPSGQILWAGFVAVVATIAAVSSRNQAPSRRWPGRMVAGALVCATL